MKSNARIAFFAFLFLMFLATLSFATNVTWGYILVYSFPTGGVPSALEITAGGLALYVPVYGGSWDANCFYCDHGTVVDVNGSAAGTALGVGVASNFGVVDCGNPNAPYQSVLSFTGPSIWLNHEAGLYTTPFTFTAHFAALIPSVGPALWTCHILRGKAR